MDKRIMRRHGLRIALGTFLTLSFCGIVIARAPQGLDPATLVKPPADSWPTYHGDYSGQRHSKLTQIPPDNVNGLWLAWAWQSGTTAQSKAAPIPHNGGLHVTAAGSIGEVDPRTVRQNGRYAYPNNQGFHI